MGKPVSELTPEELRKELVRCRGMAAMTTNSQLRKSRLRRVREIENRLRELEEKEIS